MSMPRRTLQVSIRYPNQSLKVANKQRLRGHGKRNDDRHRILLNGR